MNSHSPKDVAFMRVAQAISTLATCNRRKVGAVITVENRIVSTGFNGAPSGLSHCVGVGCDIEHGHCVSSVHAELNAVIQAGWYRAKGGTLYTTASPCRACMGAIINAGITVVYYADRYQDPTHEGDKASIAFSMAKRANIRMEHLNVSVLP